MLRLSCANFLFNAGYVKELESLVVLNHIPHLGPVKARKLIEQYGSASEALASIPSWKTLTSWKEDLDLVQKQGISLLPFTDPKYPDSLKILSDFPLLLYINGRLEEKDCKSIGVVGTRQCTLYGREMADSLAQDFAAVGFTVVSGLARGIDTAAHSGALKSGRTIAILGSGLGYIYPKENNNLAEQIACQGAVISENPMNTQPDKYLFPRRNRLISALSQGMLLIEAPIKSGAMITMDMAFSQGKKCFALPGRADCETFKGNHSLIKKGRASLVENYPEMVNILQPENPLLSAGINLPLPLNVDPEELRVIESFPPGEISLEEIAFRTKLPIAKLSSLLMGLVLKQIVREFPGKLYKKEKR